MNRVGNYLKSGFCMKWLEKNIVLLMFGGVLLLFLLNFSLVFIIDDKEIRGTFGDQFGAVNALFSGLAFAGLIYTIILQRRDLKLQRQDLKLQRDELALTRKEMEEQTAEFEKQNETLRIQRFENTFFQMLHLHHEIVNGISFQYEDVCPAPESDEIIRNDAEVHGRDAFRVEFYHTFGAYTDFETASLYDDIKEKGIDGYNKSQVPVGYDHYFRNLYRIIKFTDETGLIGDEDKKGYIDLLRAQLSPYELLWLYYNGLSEGKDRMKQYIEDYSLLNNFRKDLIVKTDKYVGEYDDKAFQ